MRDQYRETFDEIRASEALRQEVLNMTKQEKAAVKRQMPRIVLIAAVIILALAGTTLAASLSGLPDWFSQQWVKETGKTIEKDQMGVITGLTDEVGVSAEAGGVTVTVDSVTRGEGIIWVLMRITGIPSEEELAARMSQYERPIEGLPEGITPPSVRHYSFVDLELLFQPELEDTYSSWSYPQETRGEDGSLVLLLRYVPPVGAEATPLDAEEMTLRLGSLHWGALAGDVPVAEGPWELTFSLPALEPVKPLTTGKCRVTGNISPEGAWSLAEDGPLPTEEVEFQDIQVTPTGVRFLWADPQQMSRVDLPGYIELAMKDGTKVRGQGGGSYRVEADDGQVLSQATQYVWPVPVDLNQVEALSIGGERLELK